MKEKRIRNNILIAALFLLILANIFNGSLSISFFQRLYIDSLISIYQTIFMYLKQDIERAIGFGKSLEKFIGINDMLQKLQHENPDLSNISIADTNGTILYSLNPSLVNNTLPPGLNVNFDDNVKKKKGRYSKEYISVQDHYHILLPIRDKSSKWLGTIDASFPEKLIMDRCKEMIIWNLRVLGITTLVAAILLAVNLLGVKHFSNIKNIQEHKTRLYVSLFLILGTAQIIYSFYNVQSFRNRYFLITQKKIENVSDQLNRDIEFLLKKGISIDRMIKMEKKLNEIVLATPEIEDIRIYNTRKEALYWANSIAALNLVNSAVQNQIPEISDNMMYNCTSPLKGQDGTIEGYLNVQISSTVIFNKLKDVILDSATVVLISFIFITELMVLLFVVLKKISETDIAVSDPSPEKTTIKPFTIVRPVSFIYQVGLGFPVSFIPLHAEDLYKPIFGLTKEFVMGLPISINMLFATIAFLVGGGWMDKKGWQTLHLWGVIITVTGTFLCGISTSVELFILYRGMVGFGYGLTFMSYMGFVYANTDQKNRTLGFAVMSAGMFSGSICGGAIGGMLAERLGFSLVFIASAVSMVLAVFLPYIFMKDMFQITTSSIQRTEKNFIAEIKTVFRFLFNRNVFSLLILLSIPSSIVFAGFLYYLCPIYLSRLGTSQANIARILMINGLFMIYLQPLISSAIDRSLSKKIYIVISGLLGSCGLLAFYYIDGLPAIIIAIILVSISSSFGNSSRPVYALQQSVAQELGGGKAMSIYRTIDRIGWVLGPLTLGIIVASGNLNHGLTVVGLIYLSLTILFMIFSYEMKKKE